MFSLKPFRTMFLVLTASAFAPLLHASDADDLVAALQEILPDTGPLRSALSKIIADNRKPLNVRTVALQSLARLDNGSKVSSLWADEYQRYLLLKDVTDKFRSICAAELARNIHAGSPALRQAALELRSRQKGFPIEIQPFLEPFAKTLEIEYLPVMQPGFFKAPDICAIVKPATLNGSKNLDKLLYENYLEEARAFESAKNWSGVRSIYVDLIRTYSDKKADLLDALLKSFVSESGDTKLTPAAASAFTGYVLKNVSDNGIAEEGCILVAQVYFRDDSFEQALDEVNSYRQQFPGSANGLQADLIEALVYSRTERNDKAVVIFDRLAKQKLNTEIAQKAQFLMGWTYLFNQDSAKAKESLEALIRDYPDGEYAKKAKDLMERLPK